jgi:hypothetical protein
LLAVEPGKQHTHVPGMHAEFVSEGVHFHARLFSSALLAR